MRALLELRLVCRALVSSAKRCVPALEAVAFADLSVSVPEEGAELLDRPPLIGIENWISMINRYQGFHQQTKTPRQNKHGLLVQGSKRKIVCVRRSPLAQRRDAVLVK